MKLVILESPYAGNIKENLEYARLCVKDSLMRGEAPIASHLLYTQMLDDNIPEERSLGIGAGLAWLSVADMMVAYIDLGWSNGMKAAWLSAQKIGKPQKIRSIFGLSGRSLLQNTKLR